MNTAQISKWLRKTPQPATIVIDDGKKVDVGSKGGRWTEVARTIEAMGATKLTALDSKGDVIRAIVMDDDESEDKQGKHEQHRAGCPTCGVDLNGFASILADAYDKGARAQSDAYKSIFEENTKLVKLLADRLGALEMAWQKSMQNHARLLIDMAEADADRVMAEAEAAKGGDDGIGGLIKAGLEAAAAQDPPPPQSNGHRKGARK